MINVVVFKDENNNINGFRCSGHAGFAKNGHDIVCAAVSVLVLNTINAVSTFTSDTFTYHEDEKSGTVEFRIKSGSESSFLLLKTWKLGMDSILEEYGKKYISIKD